MALVLREADVERVIDMDAVIGAVDAAMVDLGLGKAQNQPRRRAFSPGGLLNVMFATHPAGGYMGLKSYTVAGGKARFLVALHDMEGVLAALIEADLMGAYRTGAATAVAARALAAPGRVRVGLIGTGWQAQTQVLALSRVLEIDEISVFGRDLDRRVRFAAQAEEDTGVRVLPAPSPEDAVRGSQVVVAVTTSPVPVIEEDWVEEGALVAGVGSNFQSRAELPAGLFARAGLVVVDQMETARGESGDLAHAAEAGTFDWETARELGPILAGREPGRESPDQTVVFESHGLAIWDVAAGATVVAAARAAGLGQEIDLLG